MTRPSNIDLRRLRRQAAAMKGWARRRRDWHTCLNSFGHAERFYAFLSIRRELESEPPATYWRLLADVWIGTESPSDHGVIWANFFADPRPDRDAMMNDDERAALARLPDLVTVYRGVGHPDFVRGFAWTLDRAEAVRFAHRAPGMAYRATMAPRPFEHTPLLVTGTVRRSDVIAYMDDRNEREIIALPEHVQVQSVEPAPAAELRGA